MVKKMDKWLLNKIAAVIFAVSLLMGFAKYYQIYNFNVPRDNTLIFWIPLGILGIVAIITYILTFKAKKDEKNSV